MIGREKEKQRLLEAIHSSKSEFVAVYGRRRIGKTFLIRKVFGDKFAFQHTGLANVGMARQLREFQRSLNGCGRHKWRTPKDWYEAFDFLSHHLESCGGGKKVVFLDELPWMDTAKSNFVSALEHFWNGWASARNDVVLIVCGSATSWVINKVINDHGGLHNRVTKRIYLRPFTLNECERMARKNGVILKRLQLLEYYMVAGGVPFYWEQLAKGESLAQNIDRIFFSEDGELHDEFGRLYSSLFRKPSAYIAIVTALGKKKVGMTRDELAETSKQKKNGKFSERLKELEQCGFIRKYTMTGRIIRDSLYQLIDNYTLFYFKFMSSRTTTPNYWSVVGNSQVGRIWCGLAFERVCLQHVDQIKKALGISDVLASVYGWRQAASEGGSGAQIDLVIERNDRVTNLCEMKFTAGEFVISDDYERNLRNKVDSFVRETGTENTIHLTMVTSCGLKRNANAECVQHEIKADALFEQA